MDGVEVEQSTLFDIEPKEVERHEEQPEHYDRDGLSRIALLYTGTEAGNNSGVRFAMSIEDAMAWCSHEMSRGVLRGTRWAYFWTSALNFIECHWGGGRPKFDFSKAVDNGQWDERIASLGLRKYSFHEFPDLFGPLGIEVLPPKVRRNA